jgi:hypothetical protein
MRIKITKNYINPGSKAGGYYTKKVDPNRKLFDRIEKRLNLKSGSMPYDLRRGMKDFGK